jgi:replicative DNA helicase
MENQAPPHNLDFERSILSSCLHHKEDLTEFAALLKANDFYSDRHQLIFQTMLNLYAESKPVDLSSLNERLDSKALTKQVGGAAYISKIFDEPIAISCEHYAEVVKDHAIRRQIIEIGNAIFKKGHKKDKPANELLDESQQLIFGLSNNTDPKNEISPITDLLISATDRYQGLYENPGSTTGIASGFFDLDKMTCGFQNSDLIIVAARPSMGKTAFMCDLARNAALDGYSCGIFSSEMSKAQIADRFIAGGSSVNLLKFRSGKFSSDDWQSISEAQSKFYQLPIFVDDTPSLSYGEIRRRGRRMKLKHSIDIYFIDYLQLMTGDKHHGRVEEISSITRNLKAMAKELNAPVIALSQLNRAVENRENKRPKLADLRDSGAIEQDADLVLFIYRDEVYHSKAGNEGQAEIIIAKQRNGPTGRIGLKWNPWQATFMNNEPF